MDRPHKRNTLHAALQYRLPAEAEIMKLIFLLRKVCERHYAAKSDASVSLLVQTSVCDCARRVCAENCRFPNFFSRYQFRSAFQPARCISDGDWVLRMDLPVSLSWFAESDSSKSWSVAPCCCQTNFPRTMPRASLFPSCNASFVRPPRGQGPAARSLDPRTKICCICRRG